MVVFTCFGTVWPFWCWPLNFDITHSHIPSLVPFRRQNKSIFPLIHSKNAAYTHMYWQSDTPIKGRSDVKIFCKIALLCVPQMASWQIFQLRNKSPVLIVRIIRLSFQCHSEATRCIYTSTDTSDSTGLYGSGYHRISSWITAMDSCSTTFWE